MRYDFSAIEAKWQAHWASRGTFHAPNPGEQGFDPDKPKFYVLDMFPYPSGVGLHVGHPLGYIATDIVARYKRMRGYNVLHPMGYDAFGLAAEQFAVEHGVHPRITTEKNIANMTRQLKRLGLSYDWERAFATTEPGYYKWTQWIFLQMFHAWFDTARGKARPIEELEQMLASEQLYVTADGDLIEPIAEGLDAIGGPPVGALKWHELNNDQRRELINRQRLAYLDEVNVNWCPALGTVLANEEVTNEGRSERGNYPVFKRPLRQWMLRITTYCDRLEKDLERVDWPEPIKLMQRNWIGRSEGVRVDFPLAYGTAQEADEVITVFTTRPDTLFGATYMVLAPEHPLVDAVTTAAQRDAVREYQKQAASKSDVDRQAATKEKTGVFTGGYAVNPVNNDKIPIWIADYVMTGYGTGAIMAVPAHDSRDFEFAGKFSLPIRDVVYTPPLAAIAAFAQRADLADASEDQLCRQLVDFVGLCINQNLTDYDAAFQIIHTRREKELFQGPVGSNRGAIAMIWQDTIRALRDSVGLERLLHAARTGELIAQLDDAETEAGLNVHSENEEVSLNGLPTAQAKQVITAWLEQRGIGRHQVQYKLRDWIFSRQRYWGEPFPILHGPDGEVRAVDPSQLPVELPAMEDFKPEASDDPDTPPRPPLARAPRSWRVVEIDGVPYERELNTMPQWAGSCWYYLRFCDSHNPDRFVGRDAEQYWMLSDRKDGRPHAGGVDLYVGGAEHAVLHLLYARFWHKVLYDLGYVCTPEPFGRLFNQGYIQAYYYENERGVRVPAEEVTDENGTPACELQDQDVSLFYQGQPVKRLYGKMGKSLKNAITPDEICEQYGCDTMRLYEMYLGPLDQSKLWNTRDIIGVHRFLQRLWRNFVDEETGGLLVTLDPPDEKLRRLLHRTIKRVTDAMNAMTFNTAIAALIELNNELVAIKKLPREVAEGMLRCLGPIAPHICEELWEKLGYGEEQPLAYAGWPRYDEALLVEAETVYPVQINGKVRGRITVPADADDQTVERTARQDEKIAQNLEGKTVRKVIVVKGKLLNIVAN